VQALRDEEEPLVTRWKRLEKRMETDWNTKIDGFEVKAALGAPKHYWKERGDRHENLLPKLAPLGVAGRSEWSG